MRGARFSHTSGQFSNIFRQRDPRYLDVLLIDVEANELPDPTSLGRYRRMTDAHKRIQHHTICNSSMDLDAILSEFHWERRWMWPLF